MTKLGVTIIIAAHNESENIESTLKNIVSTFSEAQNMPFEIFVSEDGSSDGTREIVTEFAKNNKVVRLSTPSSRLGYSRALIRGILESQFPTICFMDGDGQTNAEDIIKLVDLIQPGHVVVGYRNPRVDGKIRKLQSFTFYVLFRILGFPKMKDVSSGSVVMNKAEIMGFAKREPKLSFGFWWEFQAWRDANCIEIIEVPVKHGPRAHGTTQVYKFSRLMHIALVHIVGLFSLKTELRRLRK
jgi:glycosyltransferase involved in cell wall biosynthesis